MTRRPTKGDRALEVYGRLRDLIVRGQLAPGTRLIEMDIADRFHVSRTPVRGALQRLAQEGYVVVTPGKRQARPSVAPLTLEDAQELFEIVGQLEGLAARAAGALPDGERKELAARLKEANGAFAEACRAVEPDPGTVFLMDERFHGCYVTQAAGPRLRALHDAVKPQAERYERLYATSVTAELSNSIKEHERIVAAIAAGDPVESEDAVRTNWRNAAARLGKIIARTGERGSW